MSDLTSEIVDRAIRHARRLSRTDGYDWQTARAALTSILADLETRDPGNPSLDRLRRFIADGDRGALTPRTRAKRRDPPQDS